MAGLMNCIKLQQKNNDQNNKILLIHPCNSLFSRTTWYQKGKTSQDLNQARDDGVLGWQWHQMDHTQTICNSLQTDNNNNTSSLNLYRPDALPVTQPTASKHWRLNKYNQIMLKMKRKSQGNKALCRVVNGLFWQTVKTKHSTQCEG